MFQLLLRPTCSCETGSAAPCEPPLPPPPPHRQSGRQVVVPELSQLGVKGRNSEESWEWCSSASSFLFLIRKKRGSLTGRWQIKGNTWINEQWGVWLAWFSSSPSTRGNTHCKSIQRWSKWSRLSCDVTFLSSNDLCWDDDHWKVWRVLTWWESLAVARDFGTIHHRQNTKWGNVFGTNGVGVCWLRIFSYCWPL